MKIRRPELWVCGSPRKRAYGFGYWCQGPESVGNDGLLRFRAVQGQPERVRERYLSGIFGNPLSAVLDFLRLNVLHYLKQNHS